MVWYFCIALHYGKNEKNATGGSFEVLTIGKNFFRILENVKKYGSRNTI
jgi:hypothetical protein